MIEFLSLLYLISLVLSFCPQRGKEWFLGAGRPVASGQLHNRFEICKTIAIWTIFQIIEILSGYRLTSLFLTYVFVFRWLWRISCVSPSQEARVQVHADYWHTKSLNSQANITASSVSGEQMYCMKVNLACIFSILWITHRFCGFIVQALGDNIPPRNLGGVFDAVNESQDLVSDSRSASPTPSLYSNRSGETQTCH